MTPNTAPGMKWTEEVLHNTKISFVRPSQEYWPIEKKHKGENKFNVTGEALKAMRFHGVYSTEYLEDMELQSRALQPIKHVFATAWAPADEMTRAEASPGLRLVDCPFDPDNPEVRSACRTDWPV
jgi:hypothetical protein